MSNQLQRVDRAPGTVGLPSPDEWRLMWNMGQTLVASGFLPRSVDTAEKAITIMLKGRELGWPPMRSFEEIHVIEGKPSLSAKAMMALIYEKAPGARIYIVETTNEACRIDAARPGQEALTRFAFTVEDAHKADLFLKKGETWRRYTRAMLRSRCVSEMARALFPDALMGFSYTPEELDAEVNEDGEVIDVAPVPPKAEPKAAPAPQAPPAPPQSAADASSKRTSMLYTRTDKQVEWMKDFFTKRNVAPEIWEKVDNALLNKPFTALATIVKEEQARLHEHLTKNYPTELEQV